MQLPRLRSGSRSLGFGLVALGSHLIDDILGSKDLLLRILKLQFVQFKFLAESRRFLVCTFTILGGDPQAMKVIEGTTFRGVCAGSFCFETLIGDDEGCIDLADFFLSGDEAC